MNKLCRRPKPDRFPFWLLIAATFLSSSVLVWLIFQVHQTDERGIPSVFAMTAIFTAASLMWLSAFYVLYKWQSRSLAASDRNNEEDALEMGDPNYRMLFESNPNPVLVFDLETLQILAVNKEMVLQYGYTREELLGMSLEDIRPPEDIPILYKQVAIGATEQGKLIPNLRHRTKDGTIIDVEIAAHPVTFEGRDSRIVLISDITERKQTEAALRQSEEKYRTILETVEEAYFEIDLAGSFTFFNDAMAEFLGYDRDELKGLNYRQYVDEETARDLFSAYNKVFTTGEPLSLFEYEVIRKDGARPYFESSASLIRNGAGEPVGFRGVVRNISDRKRAREEFQENLSLLTSTLAATADGILVVDNGNKIVTFNQQFVDMARIPDEFIGTMDNARVTVFVMDQLLNGDILTERIEQLNLRPETQIYDVLKFKDGRIFESYSHPRSLDGKVVGRVVSFHDITERKQSEEALERYRTILETLEEPYYEDDLAGNLTFFNDALVGYLGYSKEELKGLNYRQYVDKETADYLFNGFNEVFATGGAVRRLEYEVIRKDGTRLFVESSTSLMRNPAGEPVGFRGVVRDINDRKHAEEALRQSEEKYRTILETIEEGYYETDLAGNFTFVNDAMATSFRFSRDELEGLSYRRYVDEETAKNLFQTYNQVFVSGQPVSNLEFEVIRKDKTKMSSETSIALIRDAGGTPIGFRGLIRDINERKRAEDTLRESAALLAAAQRITHLGSWELDLIDLNDLSRNEVRWSDETYRIFGFEPGQVEISHKVFDNAVHPDDRSRIGEVLLEAIEKKQTYNIEYRIILPTGQERTLHAQAEFIFESRTGEPVKLLGTVQDITERKRADEALRESEYKLRTLFASMSEGMAQVDNDEVMEFVNDRLCEMTGYDREELLGKTTLEMLFDEEGCRYIRKTNDERQKGVSSHYELRLRKKSGEMLWVAIGGAPIINADGIVTGTMGVFADISERKRAEEQLLHDAFHDGLTGLANRALFMDHLRMTIERCKGRHSKSYAVLFLDLDRFKVVNDSLGHAEGDKLLNQVARRLESSVRTGDLVARLGGDEFVVLLSEMLEEGDAFIIAERILSKLTKPFDLDENEILISASIGIALSNAGHKRAEDMLRDADIAMYDAKAQGKARYKVFDQTMSHRATSQLQLDNEMRQALDRGQFELYYQPIIDLKTNALAGFEALVRWMHPKRGRVSPMEFIPAAEENGLIHPLSRWILNESCRQLRAWQKGHSSAASLSVSVNLSCKQFLRSDLADHVAETLAEHDLEPRCLKLEITESHLMEHSGKAVKIMNRLRNLGVELSLDDFGTGYSSLSYLHRLPLDYLKVDRSFVSRMAENKENSEFVNTIIKLAQNLKLKVIAEGIETAEQLEGLKLLNCEYGQGYFFSEPLKADMAVLFLEAGADNFANHGSYINYTNIDQVQ